MQLILKLTFFLQYLWFLALFIGCARTNSVKDINIPMPSKESQEIIGANQDSTQFHKITRFLDSYNEKGGKNPSKDSLKNWFKEYEKNNVDFAPKISDSTKLLLIDTLTNQIINATILKFKGFYDAEKANNNENIDKVKYEKLFPVISKNWALDNDSISSIEFPDLRNLKKRIGFFDATDNFLVVVETDAQEGALLKIYFFNNNGILINSFEYEKTISVPIFGFNKEKTFFYIASLVSPEIFIYKPDGAILLVGDYHSLTGDQGTSYSHPIISKTGKFIILKNNFAFIFEDKILISKIKYNGASVIDEELKLIAYEYQNTLYINDIKENCVKYIFPNNNIYLVKILPRSEIIFTKYGKRKNRLSYEVFDF